MSETSNNASGQVGEPVELKQLSGDASSVQTTKEVRNEHEMKSPQSKLAPVESGVLRVVLASLVASIGSLAFGFSAAFPSPAIPDINSHPNPFRVTRQDQSWIASAGLLGGLLAAPLAAFLVDRFGRKTTLLLSAVPVSLGWVVMVCSQHASMLVVARIVIGFATSSIMVSTTTYIAEIAPPRIRGRLMSTTGVFRSVGMLLAYTAGAFVRWNWLAVVGLCLPLLLVLLLIHFPETPRWLLMRGRTAEATEALTWLRAGSTAAAVQSELMEIQLGLKVGSANRKPMPWCDFLRPPLLKMVGISLGVTWLHSFSGVHVLNVYNVTVFQLAGGDLDPYKQAIVIGVVMVAGSICCSAIIDRMPRRVLLISGLGVMATGWLAEGAFFLVMDRDNDFALAHLYWLPLLSMVVVVFGSMMGVQNIYRIISSEIFHTRARGLAASMNSFFMTSAGFVSILFFLPLLDAIGSYGIFFLYSGICVAGSVFAYCFVPDTRGKSLEKVQQELKLNQEIKMQPLSINPTV